MKIAVLGATGATGDHVITQALDTGHHVVAYVRRPDALQRRPGLTVIAGQLDDIAALTSAFQNVDAVISCVGPKLDLHTLRKTDVMQRSLPTIIAAMTAAGVSRLVLVSAFGVGDTAAKASLLARIVYRITMSGIYGDKERSETALPNSGLNWTTVYPVILNDGPRTGVVHVQALSDVTTVAGLPKVSRAAVAAVLLDLAADQNYSGERLLITS